MRTLNIENNDLVLTAGNLEMVTGSTALQIIITNRLKLWLGEWYLAPDSGIDWLGLMGQSNAIDPVKRITAALRDAILADTRVDKINSMVVEYARATRKVSATISIKANNEKITVTI